MAELFRGDPPSRPPEREVRKVEDEYLAPSSEFPSVSAAELEDLEVLEVAGIHRRDSQAGQPDELARGAERWTVLRRLLGLADISAGLTTGALAALIGGLAGEGALAFTLLSGTLWIVVTFTCGLYGHEGLRSWVSGIPEAPRLLAASVVVSWPTAAIALSLGAHHAIIAGLFTIPTVAVFTALGRALARAIAHSMTSLRQRTLIVGSGFVAAQLAHKLRTSTHYGLNPIGVIDNDVHHAHATDLPHLGRLDELVDRLSSGDVDRVIIAFSRAPHEQLLAIVRACRDRWIAVDVVPRLFEFIGGARSLDEIGGLPLLSISDPRLTRSSRVAKRALDLLGSGTALLVVAPLFLVVSVAIKLESPGPVFFRQSRAGYKHRTIEVLKFRSMFRDADQRKLEYAAANDADDGVMFKIKKDPRITRVGRLLRSLSLDELPQFINVLRGDMSLVGPRPLIFEETDALALDWHHRRLDLRPGITGPWQISGRSDIPFQEMIRFDYQYVAGWSLARDVEIILATVPAVLSRRGAY